MSVFVAAGSNIEPQMQLRRALDALEEIYGPLRISPAYRNKAVGFDGADFINLVVGFETDDPVERVRPRLQAVEKLCGRPPNAPKWAPRSMDLDILLHGQQVRDDPDLKLPRPDLIKRPYMLKPMADIAPDVIHPTLGKTMAQLWQELDDGQHEMVLTEL